MSDYDYPTKGYEAFKIEEAVNRIASLREQSRDHLSRYQRFGASVMTIVGKTSRLLGFAGDERIPEMPTAIEKNAYRPRFTVARKVWATLGLGAIAGASIGAGYAVDGIDNFMACRGMAETPVTVAPGDTLSGIASQVPHANTPLSTVEKAIEDMNDSEVFVPGTNLVLEAAELEVPESCESRLAMPGF